MKATCCIIKPVILKALTVDGLFALISNLIFFFSQLKICSLMACKSRFIVVFKNILIKQLQIDASVCSTIVEYLTDRKLELEIIPLKSFTVVNNLLKAVMSFNTQNYRLSEKKVDMCYCDLTYCEGV